ncbi:GNAT family N-acetyltransferase [Alkalibacterium kapii]|uniref:N-acetyltransferase n=1 Tax=Alkalibacterium kapii TaxID=426704 RepID=A0A511AQQ4_9LACT|nr:GNAT family protein [Alkalibacterium kapii]GEK90519.1 N-acetyltransferase [Alkalibacterium kapii]
MSEAIDCIIREAIPSDAEAIIDLLNETATQTGYLTQGADDLSLSLKDQEKQLDLIYDSSNNVVFVASVQNEIIGIASISASLKPKIKHIGEVGIVIDQSYWGMGLGQMMMEELLSWAEETETLGRLELKVQERNQRARHLYEKLGFKLEAVMERGVKDKERYLDVCLMSKMI